MRTRLFALLMLIAAGCAHGPNPACIAMCESHNDACMLNAHDAYAVQRCDYDLTACMGTCR